MPRADTILSKANITLDAVVEANLKDAHDAWASFRHQRGFANTPSPLLSEPKANMKLAKSGAYGLGLAPFNISGYNVCPNSTPECRRGCVSFSGNGLYPKVQGARIAKTEFLMTNPLHFMAMLVDEISTGPLLEDLPVRLNTFSDIAWERLFPWLFEMFDVQFYDYTKRWDRLGDTPANYALAGSVSEKTKDAQIDATEHPLAVVFNTKKDKPLPETWHGRPVVDGDLSDRWIIDHQGTAVIGGLRAKGKLRKGDSPFVRSAT